MTTTQELIAELWASDAASELTNRAARHIESLSAEVERLTAAAKYAEHIDATPENQRETMLHDALTERDQLSAQLEAQGEAVAYVKFKDGAVHFDTDDNIVISNTPDDCVDESIDWRPVFTHPAPAAPVVPTCVWSASNRTATLLFWTKEDAEKVASQTPAAGIEVGHVPVFGIIPTQPKGEKA